MNEMEYNAAEGIRRSDLWKMEDSAEKFRWNLEHPIAQTPAMAFGSACHKYILENDTFFNEYVIAPEINRRTNAGKEEWAAFCEANKGKELITQEEYDKMEAMRTALKGNPLANELICGENGTSETALFWKDPETGERCKAKLDRLVREDEGKYIIVDYKTAKSAETARFNNEVFRLGYHFQAGFYTDGLMQAAGVQERPRFIFVAQEKEPPYAVNVIEVSEDVMKVGVAKFHELLEKYHDCKEADLWPGYMDGEVPNETTLPGWWSLEGEDE